MAESWELKDSLRQMTEKFNANSEELLELRELHQSNTEAFEKSLTAALTTMSVNFSQIDKELQKKIESVSAEDIGLENADNTSDMDKPVSIAQAEAIQTAKTEAMANMLTSEEEEEEVVTGDEPEVNPVLISLISSIVQEILAEEGAADYGIASELVLGVVKASEEVLVDSITGKMTIEGYSLLKQKVQSLVTGLGSPEQLKTTAKDSLVNAVNELFQSVSDGKSLVASAITDKGVATESTATFEQMSQNINQISGNVDETQVISCISEYELTNDLSNLITPFQDGQATLFKGELHIIGGIVNNASYGHQHLKWDGTNWVTLDDLPLDIFFGNALTVFSSEGIEEIHIFGGSSVSGDYKQHYKWDGETWTKLGSIPVYGKDARVAVTKDSNNKDVIHLFYGTSHCYMNYGEGSTEWVTTTSLPYSAYRANAACCVLHNEIYFVLSNGNTSCYWFKLTEESGWSTVESILETSDYAQYLDHSLNRSSTYVTMSIYQSYPMLVAIEETNEILLFTAQYYNGSLKNRTYVMKWKVGVNTYWDVLYDMVTIQGGNLIVDSDKRILYSVGGSYSQSTTRNFRAINYDVYAKLTN